MTVPTIDHMLVLAGLSCAGKTTLYERMCQGQCPRLCAQLDIRDPAQWTFFYTGDFRPDKVSTGQHVILHYDLYVQSLPGHDRFKHLTEFMFAAQRVSILTLGAPAGVLECRARKRMQNLWFDPAPIRQRLRRFRLLRRKASLYRHKSAVARIHACWLNFLQQAKPDRSLFLDTSGPLCDGALEDHFAIAARLLDIRPPVQKVGRHAVAARHRRNSLIPNGALVGPDQF